MSIARLLLACFFAIAAPLAAGGPSASAAEDAAQESLVLDVAAAAFGAFAAKHVGKTVEVPIDGAVVSSPMVRDPIFGAKAEKSP